MNNIKAIRKSKGITQKELAEAANVSSPYIFDLENGRRNAKLETWERIAAALGCTIGELVKTDNIRLIRRQEPKTRPKGKPRMRLKEVRASTNLTQDDVARALNISRTTVTMWESGVVNPTAAKLPAIAKLYGCSINDLFDDEEKEGSA